jgi:ferredoxin
VDAIKRDTEPGQETWLHVNAEFALIWPNITAKRAPPTDAKAWQGVSGKFERYFSPKPGIGD